MNGKHPWPLMAGAAAQLELCGAEAHIKRILASRHRANASGQRGEDVDNIRAAYLSEGGARAGLPCPPCTHTCNEGRDCPASA